MEKEKLVKLKTALQQLKKATEEVRALSNKTEFSRVFDKHLSENFVHVSIFLNQLELLLAGIYDETNN